MPVYRQQNLFAPCVAHARRKVFEARGNSPVQASMLLSMFRQLYDKDVLDRLLAGETNYDALRRIAKRG
jgi:hypothetical protein